MTMQPAALLVLLVAPLAAAGVSYATRSARVLHGVNLSTMTALIIAVAAVTAQVYTTGPFKAWSEIIYIDALSSFILVIIALLGFCCSLYTWSYLDEYVERGVIAARRLSRYFFLFHLFLFAMILATVANSLGVQWVAIEGTTLATTFLIAFFRRRESLEAGWKYLILCSVGIALALFGVVLAYYSSVRVLGDVSTALNLTKLEEVATYLDPHVLKVAFIFLLVGYGTKIGLVPMHTWVPEAYSEAPAPVTAMLAGVLETVAVYAVLRAKTVVDRALPGHFTGNLLLVFGLASFGLAALFILVQRDYKRLFAYSSIEHMGIALIGFGAGGAIGTFGGLFHLLNHALAKALAFFAAGNLYRRFETRMIAGVQGLAQAQPATAAALLVAGLALVGMPPFSIFASELMVLSSLASQSFGPDTLHVGRFLTITIADEARSLTLVMTFLVFAVALFGGFTYRLAAMVWGTPPDHVKRGEAWELGHVPLALTALALVLLGLTLPAPVRSFLDQAVNVLLR